MRLLFKFSSLVGMGKRNSVTKKVNLPGSEVTVWLVKTFY